MAQVSLLQARYVVPVRPANVVLQHHSVIIEGARIKAVLPTATAVAEYPRARVVELPNHVLLPGLINMHTHSPMTLLRGYADDLDLGVWLKQHIWPMEQQFVSEAFVADGTALALVEMLRAGTTCFNDNYFFPDIMARVAKHAGMRACIGLPVIELQTAWARDADECLAKGQRLLEEWQDDPLITFAYAPHAPYTVSDHTLQEVVRQASRRGLPVHMHVLETPAEIQHSLQEHGLRPLQRLERLGLMNPLLLAVHMTQLAENDIELLAATGVHVIHCPQSNLKLASGICPVSTLSAASVNIALGTDGAASNNNLDLLGEAQTAALLAKGFSGQPESITAFEALEMLTINGARALGLEQEIGSIEPGKQADLAALDLSAPETQPLHHVVSQLIYAASSSQFSDVWVAGNRLLDHGELRTLDMASVLARAEHWRVRMSQGQNQPTQNQAESIQ